MPISGNVPQHLVVGAKSGFLTGLTTPNLPWQRIAGQMNTTAKTTDIVDLGAAPMPSEGSPVEKDFIEKSLQVKARDWSTIVTISHNAIQDDQTGTLQTKARSAGERFQMHINGLVFKALDAGDASTYGLCYDGNEFYDASHIDKGAKYNTAQANTGFALALSLDNFTTVLNAGALFVDDQGEYVEHAYDMLVVPPAVRRTAAQITGNPEDYGTANRAVNPFNGVIGYTVSPNIAAASWHLLASSETAKPIYLAMREQPNLQDAWFDPTGPDGGLFKFKYYARYNIFYGDWRLALLGHT
jgi:phage major head subunit gpT-like protein